MRLHRRKASIDRPRAGCQTSGGAEPKGYRPQNLLYPSVGLVSATEVWGIRQLAAVIKEQKTRFLPR
jgi:hypothetical protein